MPPSDPAVVEEVRRVVAAQLPDAPLASVAWLGAGLDNQAFLVDGELVVRRRADDEDDDDPESLSREAGVLRLVAPVVPVAVPEPVFVSKPFMAYRLLPGVPLLDVDPAVRAAHAVQIGRALGAVLAALWAVPAAEAERVVDRDETSPGEWREEAAAIVARHGDALPPSARPGVEAFVRAPVPRDTDVLVLSHNDLGLEHVLAAPGTCRVTGIIDWTDAALVDPAKDLGLILRDLGPQALDAALAASGGDGPGVRERAAFYARCLALEDLAFGLEHDLPRYATPALAALRALFG